MVEILVALDVTDHDGYQSYRDAISPLLEQMGGGFRYDFTIDKTLKNWSGHAINRVFTIFFPDEEARDQFFSDEVYLEIKKRLFESSVNGMTIIGEYQLTHKHT